MTALLKTKEKKRESLPLFSTDFKVGLELSVSMNKKPFRLRSSDLRMPARECLHGTSSVMFELCRSACLCKSYCLK